MDIEKDFTWVKHHLILVAVLLLAVFAGVWGVQGIIDKHDQAKDLQFHEELAAARQDTKQALAAAASHDAEIEQREESRDALVKSLVAQVSLRDAQLQDALKKNATLTAQQAAAKLVEQYNAQPTQAQAQGDNVLVDLPLTRQIVGTKDSLTACQGDLTDTQKLLTQEQGRTADLKTQVSDRDKVITAKDTELGKQKKADGEDKKVAVDNEKKKRKWYALAGAAIVTGIRIYFTGKP
jgi:hypothetical protein